MTTTIKAVPGFAQVATGSDIQVEAGPPTRYLVSNIQPYPNSDLIEGNTYNISDPSNHGIVVQLIHPPGGAMRTATFEQETEQSDSSGDDVAHEEHA
ncbi:hypothetical protein WS63_12230 [Burkholderia stagnalis]|uniref:Uncharacterized protein n=1 Tax=Burkholderia stagnalis TaxID=1503054 RepID=A0ABX9YX47_9BURK|nr:hypothetical protein [Burkholderia stagnalis]KVC57930.1 hypothetical protein WS59_04920 [Burkholderia stagnalis]KVD91029.1 hypothetical protein WS63_12230 [Burkholderia stagnalis]KVN19309.1 hypothetical protein WT10_17625 [Burkholderia stagnalis]KVO58676.1 hypothetical protein WT18_16130 [Burkholderia stagnalis]KVP10792.1 hypothetical protein WT20_18125 [Burkholderia stagnalis]